MKIVATLAIALSIGLMVLAGRVVAGDRGPQVATTTVTTNSAPFNVAIPIGDTGRFDPSWVIVSGTFGGTTQTISWVCSGQTGTLSTATAAAAIYCGTTNVPTMFYGDKFIITTTGLTTNSLSVKVIGNVFD